MPQSIGKRWVAILIAVLLLVVSAVTMAFFTDRVDHSMQFTTASFSADGYKLTRTAPEGPFCAGEEVTATLKESNTGDDDVNSIISMKATWVSPDTALSIFGNANAADNAKLSIDGTDISYKVSTDKKSITFDLPAHVLTAGTKDKARDLTLTIPASFKSTGRIEFTFEKVVVAQDGGGFSETYDRTQLNASKELDYSVRVGWAASSIAAQNGKALMGYLTEKDSVSGKFGIQFEYAFNYNTSPMKDFASKTDAKWSYYKDKADRLTFVEGMTSIGDYAFPDFELVTSLSLPESLVSVGKWSFDNISIPTLTLPAALTNFDTMSFGHINELTEITFNQAAKTDISFPTAGSTTGAFYVDPYVPTKIVGENPIAQGYDWITDQRRVAPVIRSYNYTWSGDRMSQPLDATTLTPDDDSNVDFHTAENRAKIKSVVFQDASGYYAIPDMKPGDAGGLVEKNNNMWDVSAAQNKSVIAWLKDDGTLIIAGDGVKVMANADSDWLFGDMANIETIDATLYDTSNATTMEYWHAFAEPDLRQNEGDWSGDPLPMEVPQRGAKQIVGIQDWDVSKVTSTMDMFYNANRLTSLNLGSWNTKSLKTPNGMFHGCSALTTLDVSGWNTSNVTTLQSIFSHCRGLTALDVAGWDVQKVTDMSFAFSDCGAPVLDLHTWKTNSLTTLEKAFAGAGANTINVTGWNTSKVITMDSAFENTASLGSLDLSTWDTSGVGRGTESDGTVFGTGAFNNMFFRSGAKSINVSGFDFSSLYGPKGNWNGGLYKMFGECKSLTEIVGAETWTNTGKIVELNSTFIDCEKLVTLNVSKWDTSGVTAMSNAFNGCKSLAELDVSKWNVSSCEGYINTFKDCESVKVLDISKWDMTKATPSASQNMFNGCKSLESLTFPTSVNWLATRMAANCPKLTTIEFLSTDASISQRPTAGASLGAFYVAPDAGVTVPVTTFIITHGSGMAQLKDASIYNLADDNRCLPLDLPVQSETLTYTGSEQSPSWNNFDATKMTVSGTTTAVNADTYTAKFTPKTGYAWEDGTTGAKSVTWKIGKAAGSLFVTPTEMTIALNDTTGTITVTRAGDGAITATSDKTSVATVEVNGNKITVTKKGAGTANITVKVAEGTNHKAPAGKTVVVTCKTTPELNAKNTWYTGSTAKSAITEIELKDSYTATGNEIESWDASAAQNKTVMAYVVEGTNGKKLILAGNRSGKIVANADSTSAFNGFTALTAFTGLNKLDTSNVTNMQTMFNNLDNIQTLDLSSFNTSKVTNFYSIFGGNDKLTTLNLTGWDTSAAKDMGQMFYVCNALTTINGLSSFNTANVTDMSGMFHGCKAMTSLDLSNFNTAKVKTLSMMFYQCSNLETVKLTSFDTSNVTSLYAMFQYCYKLKAADLSSFNTAKVTNMRSMFGSCKAVESLDLSSFDTSAVTNMSAAFDGCQTLQTVTLGKDFKFVGTDGYLPAPSATYISGADGNWYVAGTDTGYTPTELAAVTRVRAVTYSAIPGTDPGTGGGSGGGGGDIPADLNLAVPEQVGTLTANGSEQSPTWKNYDSSKMTISGTTSAVKAGTYTVTFTLNDGYAWFDGTAEDKDVQWTMESGAPMLAASDSWYKSSVKRGLFTKIEFIDSGTPSGTIVEQWNADVDNSGSIKAYITGSAGSYTLTIAGNGAGSIMANPNSSYAFSSSSDLAYDFPDKFALSAVTDITGMDLLDTSKVTNMESIFSNCQALTSLDVSGFDTSKVTTMSGMFSDCQALTSLDLSGFDTSKVTIMYGMFSGCSKLTSLDVSGFDTSKVTTMGNMFSGCSKLTSLDVSGFDTSKVINMGNMFKDCIKLKSVTLGKDFKFVGTNGYLPTPSSTYISGADGKWYDTNTRVGYTPSGLASVTRNAPVTYVAVKPGPMLAERRSWYKSTKVTDKRLFKTIAIINSGKPSGTIVEQWNADVDNSGSIKAYITGSSGSYTLTIAGDGSGSIMANPDSNYAFSNTGVISFSNVTSFTGTKLLNTSRVTDMSYMFSGCSKLTSLDVSGFDTSSATDMSYMFSGCSKLTSLDVSGFDTSKVADMRGTFYDCTQLKSLDVSGFDTSSVTNMYGMFYDCSALTSLDLSGFDTSSVTNMSCMFDLCKALTSLDLSGFDTSSVKEMYGMFYLCSALTSLDVSGFDTSQVTSMRNMFSNCSALTSLDLSGFDTSKVTTMDNMFRDCTKLKSVTLGKAFKFVGTNGYLPTPSSTYITGADGKWYDTNTGTGYTPEALASVERTEAVTYSAVPNAKILSGMWKFNKGLGLSRYDINANVPFKSAGKTFSSIYVPSKTTNLCFDGKNTYLEGTGWTDAAYRLISFNGSHVVTEDFYNWFVENAKPVVTLEGKWKFNETLTFDTEVQATEISYTMDGFTGVILETEYAESGKFPGWKLAVDYNVFSDMYVYGDTGLAETPLGWKNESYRTIAFNGTQYVTKDFYDWFIANAKPWSEDESGAAEKIAVPKQSGTLTYNGSAQSPSWSSYDASKMTMGGTTTGTNAGSYTTTFALNDGFKWADGTTGTKSVIWKIGKATGSVSFSKDSLNIDKNSTTDTLDVTRTGTGAITATSSDTSVATVTVNGTKVTVTKVGDGTATITVKVAADANYKEASKTCSVTCVGIPTLAYGSTWYKGSTDKASITKIQIKDSYTPSGTAAESWNADARNSGSIKAYVEGTTLTIAGNGTGKIKANALSWSVFNGFSSATAITGLDLMDTSNALTMEAMFYGCKALTALDVSKFDTSNVTSMRAMFYECENLTSLNVSKFDTASVTNVEAMFQGCKALTAVGDVSGWNTAKVTSMYQVFYGCEKLAALDLSGWNTTNVTNMQAMFLDCTSLTSVGDLSGWNTAKVTEMALLFGNCEKLASLDVSKFNTAAVTNMNAMFFNCSALTTLDVSGFDTAKTTNLAAMFSGCVSLTSLDVSNWNTSNVTTMEATFQNCKKLTTMGDVSGWDTSKVTNMREMFCQCNLITSVNVTNWKTGNVTNMNGIFSNCEKLTSVGDLSGWDTSSATDMGLIFNSCFKLTGMGDISQWDTSNATKMNCLFATCESLTELDLSGWDTSKVTDMNNIFGGYEHEQLEEGEIAGACVLLRKITLGAKFKFVGTDSYLPEPDSRYISGADGKWYAGSTGYTPAELAGLSRTEAVTYVAVKGTKTMSILSGDNAVSGYSISE